MLVSELAATGVGRGMIVGLIVEQEELENRKLALEQKPEEVEERELAHEEEVLELEQEVEERGLAQEQEAEERGPAHEEELELAAWVAVEEQ